MSQLKELINEAQVFVIGIGPGFSRAEGLDVMKDEETHTDLKHFMHQHYYTKIIDAIIGSWPSLEEEWIFWSLLTEAYSLHYQETPIMKALKTIVGDKDYFIISTTGEGHLEQAGFKNERIFNMSGSWLTMVNTIGEDLMFEDARGALEKIAQAYKRGEDVSTLIPHDQKGRAMGLQSASFEDMRLDPKCEEDYFAFTKQIHGKSFVILDLGTAAWDMLIKRPFMKLAYHEPNATYVSVTDQNLMIASKIQEKSFGYNGNMTKNLEKIATLRKR